MDLSQLRLGEGISIAIYVGELPPYANAGPGSDGILLEEDTVVIVVRDHGRLLVQSTSLRHLPIDLGAIQMAIDKALGRAPPPAGSQLLK